MLLLVPLNALAEGDPVNDLTLSLLLLSPSHRGFSASLTGAHGSGSWERLILDVAGTSKGENVSAGGGGTSSGFANTDELAKKLGTPPSFNPTFSVPASAVVLGSVR